MRILILLAAFAALPVTAQNVYKCVDHNGHISLTSDPCKSGDRVAATVYAPPEVLTREQRLEHERLRRKADTDSAYLNRLAGFESRSSTAWSPGYVGNSRNFRCEAAKSQRASVRKARGMKITYLETRRLDEMVYDACK
jgi:hypothetical protein